jgi:hypothetical protein
MAETIAPMRAAPTVESGEGNNETAMVVVNGVVVEVVEEPDFLRAGGTLG